MSKVYIKNMVCSRCITAVKNQLQKLNIDYLAVHLGEVELKNELTSIESKTLSGNLKEIGFEIIDNKRKQVIEKIKTIIIELVHQQNNDLRINLSELLVKKLHQDYTSLSTLFSEIEGTTIEKYHIAQRIEKVKELLVYDELTLSEIAHCLNYSSTAYLSNQFKKITGLTPSHFKEVGRNKRKPLDKI